MQGFSEGWAPSSWARLTPVENLFEWHEDALGLSGRASPWGTFQGFREGPGPLPPGPAPDTCLSGRTSPRRRPWCARWCGRASPASASRTPASQAPGPGPCSWLCDSEQSSPKCNKRSCKNAHPFFETCIKKVGICASDCGKSLSVFRWEKDLAF